MAMSGGTSSRRCSELPHRAQPSREPAAGGAEDHRRGVRERQLQVGLALFLDDVPLEHAQVSCVRGHQRDACLRAVVAQRSRHRYRLAVLHPHAPRNELQVSREHGLAGNPGSFLPGLCAHRMPRHRVRMGEKYSRSVSAVQVRAGHSCLEGLGVRDDSVDILPRLLPRERVAWLALQQKGRELPFREYFQPTSFLRSSGVGSTIMGVALAIGMLVTSGVETLLLFVRANLLIVLGLLVFVAAVTLFRRLARTRSSKGA
eukprot:CAMPEP_0176249998 /NCGR_PEP_ID=MMETSP0121_2-20121125/34259_1 /TAXON_ID=160619 /ORGANISM="Kryptoperidinium foliaceum, Strain CCMP 1326" /LENGTH=258 /DNA_ID=CAMNT_0017589701 /DNA_START=129 /DNA_END=906 /DNA_ORIENTATION=-